VELPTGCKTRLVWYRSTGRLRRDTETEQWCPNHISHFACRRAPRRERPFRPVSSAYSRSVYIRAHIEPRRLAPWTTAATLGRPCLGVLVQAHTRKRSNRAVPPNWRHARPILLSTKPPGGSVQPLLITYVPDLGFGEPPPPLQRTPTRERTIEYPSRPERYLSPGSDLQRLEIVLILESHWARSSLDRRRRRRRRSLRRILRARRRTPESSQSRRGNRP
jgi:hypothetical protein